MTTETSTIPFPYRRGRRYLLAAATLLPLAGCSDEAASRDSSAAPLALAEEPSTLYGPAVAVGEGTAHTYVVLGREGPVELGVALSEQVFDRLPEGHDHGHGPMAEFLLPLPREAAVDPYEFVELNWMPMGHAGTPYALPHLDFHFYHITLEERNAIDPADAGYVRKARNLLPPEQTPPNYIALSTLAGAPHEEMATPRMGMHWVDVTSPELNGEVFTTTFIYGSWDGRIVFEEPMVTQAFLESKPTMSIPIPVPEQYGQPGFYPTAYRIDWNEREREYRISLTDFARRD
jgi:hypothetical protein